MNTGLFILDTAIAILRPEWKIAQWAIKGIGGTVLFYDIHRTFSSSDFYHDPVAEAQTDYYTKDEWKYYNKAPQTISWAEAHSAFDWRFRTDSDDVFAIKITATVKFGHIVPEHWIIDHTSTTFIVISIANYWQ